MTSVTMLHGSVWTERRVWMDTPGVWGLGGEAKDVEPVRYLSKVYLVNTMCFELPNGEYIITFTSIRYLI